MTTKHYKSFAILVSPNYPRRRKEIETAATPARFVFSVFWVSPKNYGETRRHRRGLEATPPANG